MHNLLVNRGGVPVTTAHRPEMRQVLRLDQARQRTRLRLPEQPLQRGLNRLIANEGVVAV